MQRVFLDVDREFGPLQVTSMTAAAQLRNEVIAAVKKAGSSSHGKCAAPG